MRRGSLQVGIRSPEHGPERDAFQGVERLVLFFVREADPRFGVRYRVIVEITPQR